MLEILNYQEESKNKVIGYADIKITFKKPPILILRRIAHLSSEGKRWFNLPSYPIEEVDGKKRYVRYAELQDKTYNDELMKLIPKEVEEYLKKRKEMPIEGLGYDNYNEMEIPF